MSLVRRLFHGAGVGAPMARRSAQEDRSRGRPVVGDTGFQTADRLMRTGAPDAKAAAKALKDEQSSHAAPSKPNRGAAGKKPGGAAGKKSGDAGGKKSGDAATKANAEKTAKRQPLPSVPFPSELDPIVRRAVESTGIPSLYPPQGEAMKHVLAERNVLVSIPTASGKSLIAHMGIFHNLLTRGGKALYIVPLRALATEKYEELRELAAAIGEPKLRVGIATGDLDEADTKLARFDVIVTTSEKADSLIRHSAGWLREICCVVADEVHLLGDGYRGPTLEVTLARLLALGSDVRFIGLSATVGNAPDIARWLNAELITSSWRPVELKEGIFHGDLIAFADGTVHEVGGKGEPVVRLVVDTVRTDAQVLVFVNTRRSTESVALKLAPKLKPFLSPTDVKVLEEAAGRLESEDGEASQLGSRLASALRCGAAFHHAGLSSKQRRAVEDLFRARHVKTIAATPTLAAGVNLPARRVIVRDIHRFEMDLGSVPLPVLEVKQMTGRAGRPRFDPFGEAVLIAKSVDDRDRLWTTYLLGEPERISSGLGREGALRIHLLAGIATGLTPDRTAVDAFLASTFLSRDASYGGRDEIRARVETVLRFLIEEGFIEADDDGGLRPTRFGKRTSDLYVDPMSALTIRDGLAHARLVKQVEPLALLAMVASTPDVPALWMRKGDDWVDAVCTEHEGAWLRPAFENAHEREVFLSDLKTALLLDDWIHEHRLEQIEAKFGMGPGDINTRVSIAEWLLYAAEEIARMEAPDLVSDLKALKQRVHFGVKVDLLAVIRALDGVGRYRGRLLAQAGFGSMANLKKATPERLLALPGFGPRLVQGILKQVGQNLSLAEVQKLDRKRTSRRPDKAGKENNKGDKSSTVTKEQEASVDAEAGGSGAADAADDDTDVAGQDQKPAKRQPVRTRKVPKSKKDPDNPGGAKQTDLSSF